jgi:hypothetical protein
MAKKKGLGQQDSDDVLKYDEVLTERDELMVALRARGVSERQVAATFGVERTTVLRAMHNWRETNPTLRNNDPLEIIDHMLYGYQADLEELALLSAGAKSETAKVGAINARMLVRERIINLLQSTGVLPHDLGKLRLEVDVRFIAQKVIAILARHDVAEDVQRELLDALRTSPALEQEN